MIIVSTVILTLYFIASYLIKKLTAEKVITFISNKSKEKIKETVNQKYENMKTFTKWFFGFGKKEEKEDKVIKVEKVVKEEKKEEEKKGRLARWK